MATTRSRPRATEEMTAPAVAAPASDAMMAPAMEAPGMATASEAMMAPSMEPRSKNGAVGVISAVAAPPAAQTGRPGRPVLGEPVAPVSQEWQRPAHIATDFSSQRQRYRVSVDEYVRFHEEGFLVIQGLLNAAEIEELKAHSEDLMYGRVEVPGLDPPQPGMNPEQIASRYLRIHMLHRHLEIEERYLLHPRVLDVLEALIGPDVMAMQTMYFIKSPGGAGQGYHQDSYYIPTYPDSLCGAWIAVDRADEENGCVWFTSGSQHEPIYPTEERVGQNHTNLRDLTVVENVSHTDEEVNTLSRIAAKYTGKEKPAVANPGDVVFFAGHILHRSHTNVSKDRFRRALVGHYANARSFTMWGQRGSKEMSNHLHILARGWTHLPFGVPRFGTPCAANQPRPTSLDGGEPMPTAMMANMESGDMEASPQDPMRNDPTMMRSHEADAVNTA
jgi:phytanoyl-CoA hydroxylase